MRKYAKIINAETGLCEVGIGTNSAFYEKIGMTLMDVEQGYDGNWYLVGHAPTKPAPTTDELAEQIRESRDRRITACDWIMARHAEELAQDVDTSLSVYEYANWLAYRQALRDLPSQDGFPWDGGGEETPWPEMPDGEE